MLNVLALIPMLVAVSAMKNHDGPREGFVPCVEILKITSNAKSDGAPQTKVVGITCAANFEVKPSAPPSLAERKSKD